MNYNKGGIRILYIIDRLGAGGKERRLVQLLKGLEETGIETRVILLTDQVHYKEIFRLKTEVTLLKRIIRKDPLIFFKLFNICRDWKPDIIHAWGAMPAVYAAPVAKLSGIKMINASIVKAPAKLEFKSALISLLSFPFSDVIQANSNAGIKAYKVPPGKAKVIHNGFDFGRLNNLTEADQIRESLDIKTEFVAGMVSVFRSHKDYRSLISAAKRILSVRSDITFVCVGEGPDFQEMKRLAGGKDRIIFTGKREEIESIINIFDIGILLTDLEKHGEGISNSIMEYMALGKPVIATDGGGTPELVLDGQTGFLIPDKSPDILKEKIEHLLNNEEERRKMGARGRERILQEFSLEKMVREQIELYNSLLED